MNHRTLSHDRIPVYHLTASLVGARHEEDDRIQLIIAVPGAASRTMTVVFPSDAACATINDPAQRTRMRAARAAFIEVFGLPSFEGVVLLYGTARLTVAGPVESTRWGASADEDAQVIDFEALDSPAPRPYRCSCEQRLLSGQRSTVTLGAEQWPR